jgi:hypothetical protein
MEMNLSKTCPNCQGLMSGVNKFCFYKCYVESTENIMFFGEELKLAKKILDNKRLMHFASN